MPFVQAKCPNCGGFLAVDSSKDAAVCQFCNTPFIVEKAINNYNITNNVNVGAGAVVNITDNDRDFVIEGGVLKKYQGESVDVVIPNTVKVIGEDVFKELAVETVAIPDSVTEIGREAFYGCKSLKSIIIPDSVTRNGYRAFRDCESLTSVTISNSVTVINSEEFYGCKSLKSVTIPDSVMFIGTKAFIGCTSLKSVTIPDSLKEIREQAFYCCSSLTSIIIPDSVTEIGSKAFYGCASLTSVTMPNSARIGYDAFSGCTSLKRDTDKPESNNSESNNSKSGGCYVATAVYGSYDCPEVWTLRRFRDNKLALTPYGRLFIYLYYAISPTLVKWFGGTGWFKRMWRKRLDRMVASLQAKGYESTPYSDKTRQ